MGQLYTFELTPDWRLINKLSEIDGFGGSWSFIEKREGQSLKELKQIATVRSVGASTRIEGSKMTDDEVEVLIRHLDVSKLEERDQQEVAGYFEALDIIAASFRDIDITESNIKQLHNLLMKYCNKDKWHKGNYKQHSNVVEANKPDGSKHVIFQTTEPGIATEDAMRKLVEWYHTDIEAHPIVRSALFVYDFLSIHPFQDGNGRLSRLLGTLLLLKQNYSWIQYVSFEHEIENKKAEYYKVLMQCQRERPGEDVYPWIMFFLNSLTNIQNQLMNKLEVKSSIIKMSPREKKIYVFVESHPGCKSGEIAEKLNIPLPTVKRILTEMVKNKFLTKYGVGPGTNYVIEDIISVKKDLVLKLNNSERRKGITLKNTKSGLEIKKIILSPLFDWKKPEEWAQKLTADGLYIQVSCRNKNRTAISQPYMVASFNTPYNYNPVFTLSSPIAVPMSFFTDGLTTADYPIEVTIELLGSVSDFSFEVMLVYDSSE